MQRIRLTLTALGCGFLTSIAGSIANAQTRAFVGATLIDGTGGAPIHDAAIVVTDSLIDCAGTRRACAPFLARAGNVVDVSGKWIIPGLIDVHVHLTWPELTPTDSVLLGLLRAGITTVRDVGSVTGSDWRSTPYPAGQGEVERIAALARDVARRNLRGPRILYCGPGLVSSDSLFPTRPGYRPIGIRLRTSTNVDDVVSHLESQGASCIKLYSSSGPYSNPLSTIARHMQEVLQAGQAHALNGIGHSSERIPLETQLTWPWREIHHQYIPVEGLLRPESRAGLPESPWARYAVSIARFDATAPEAAALAAQVARRGIAWVPTLRVTQGACEEDCWNNLRRQAASDSLIIRQALFDPANPPRSLRDSIDATRPAGLRFVYGWTLLLHRSGVRILAGSDGPHPGVSTDLHSELEQLVAAGLTPADALAASTRNAAIALGLIHRLGTITRSKVADFLVLDADPLSDIRNVRAIRQVVLSGKMVDR